MSWTAILALAGGAYLFKALGVLLVGPILSKRAADDRSAGVRRSSGGSRNGAAGAGRWADDLGRLLPPALLAALVVSQTVATGSELVIDARLAGVVAGALSVWRGAPFWLVLVISASVTAGLRLLGG